MRATRRMVTTGPAVALHDIRGGFRHCGGMALVERHHWMNTFLGILDSAFHLTDVEQAQLIGILRDLFGALRIPERAEPSEIPAAVALEISSGFFTVALAGPRDLDRDRPVRAVTPSDMVVSVEAWRDMLAGMVLVAYPDLIPTERLLLSKILTDLLTGIGVPRRAAEFLPDDVVRAYRRLPESRTW